MPIFVDVYFLIINFLSFNISFVMKYYFFQSLILTVTINQKVVKTKQQNKQNPWSHVGFQSWEMVARRHMLSLL